MKDMNRIVRRLQRMFFGSDKLSYAQCGEDLIVSGIFSVLGVTAPTYLDLGAHHATYLSNTYYFYLRHGRGVCVEPDPALFQDIQKKRRRDVCLNVGVGPKAMPDADFFLMSASTLNTFSEEEATRLEKTTPYKIIKRVKLPIISINQIIEQHFPGGPDFISLDIEGTELEILIAFDFGRWRPPVFCIETLVFTERRSEALKREDIVRFMEKQGYFVYADTYINTIFIDRARWRDET